MSLAWLVLVVCGSLAVTRPVEADPAFDTTVQVTVQAGDTLWDLAAGVDPDADRREVVAAILKLNGLASAGQISPGDVLRIPVGAR